MIYSGICLVLLSFFAMAAARPFACHRSTALPVQKFLCAAIRKLVT